MNKKILRSGGFVRLLVILCLFCFAGIEVSGDGFAAGYDGSTECEESSGESNSIEEIDFSSEESWVCRDIARKNEVDVFYVYPTVYNGDNPRNLDVFNKELRAKVKIAYSSQIGVYNTVANVFAPYYRQVTMKELGKSADMFTNKYYQVGAKDIIAAFRYYMEHYNQGRPFILAGHSQGSMALLSLMREEFNNPELLSKLVAAYTIGYSVTDADLQNYPWIKAAQGSDDLGVVISYNTQEPDAVGSPVLSAGAICINPLNWDTTGKYAGAEENLGAVFFNDSGDIIREVKEYTGAQVNTHTGALMTSPPEKLDVRSFPEGVYHIYDYSFWYRNLQQNVAKRVGAFLK